MIPNTLSEALDLICARSSPEDLETFRSTPASQAGAALHHGPGMAMRNEWGLWYNETTIAKELGQLGLLHGDDRSGFVYTALWHRLNSIPLDVEAEVAKYRAHWAAHGCNMDGSPLGEGGE